MTGAEVQACNPAKQYTVCVLLLDKSLKYQYYHCSCHISTAEDRHGDHLTLTLGATRINGSSINTRTQTTKRPRANKK